MLLPPMHCCYRHHHHDAATFPNVLLLQLKSCFRQASASTAKLAAAIMLPPPPPLPTSGNRRTTTAYKINKKGILFTNLFFTTMVMTACSDNCGATRQRQWQCCYLQLPRIALMLWSDEREASSHIEHNKNKMTEHTDTLKILIIQLLLEYNSAVIRIILEKLAKRHTSRNRILLFRTKICLFYIAEHCFVFYSLSQFFCRNCVAACSQRCPSFSPFFSCHVLCLLFCFNAQADYFILILARKKRTFILPHLPKVCFLLMH